MDAAWLRRMPGWGIIAHGIFHTIHSFHRSQASNFASFSRECPNIAPRSSLRALEE